MSEALIERRLMAATQSLVTTNDAAQSLVHLAEVLDALGDLVSAWTGEVVRVRVTAAGQPDMVDMVKHPNGRRGAH